MFQSSSMRLGFCFTVSVLVVACSGGSGSDDLGDAEGTPDTDGPAETATDAARDATPEAASDTRTDLDAKEASPVDTAVDTPPAPPDLAPILTKIAATASKSTPSTDFGMAVEWLPTGTRWGVRADVPRNSASSAKFIWATAALFKNPIATVETPALPTFKDSDNTAAGQLIDLAGGVDAVNDFMVTKLGIPQTDVSLCHWNYGATRVATSCSDRLGGENFFTPNGALKFLEKVWIGDPVSGDKQKKLLEWSTLSPRSGYGGWIGTQLPVSVRPDVHHKAGWLPIGCCGAGFPAHYNEIGLVPTPLGEYAVVLSMRGGTSDTAMTKTLEYASCVIWHALAKDVADPFASCTAP
jgi:beta-lactamase class A